jgi:cytoskeletal protein CcmA (bactofilin family)
MFSKTKEPEVPQVPQTGAPKRAPRNGGVPSIISADVMVRGTLVSMGDVQIDGKIDGDVRANALVVGEKAIIQGDVYAEEAIVRGRVEGSIRARKVQLCATCHVEGNILHEALAVEIGAFFEGNCRHSDNPLADAPDGTTDRKSAQPARPQASAASAAPAAKPAGPAPSEGLPLPPSTSYPPLKN